MESPSALSFQNNTYAIISAYSTSSDADPCVYTFCRSLIIVVIFLHGCQPSSITLHSFNQQNPLCCVYDQQQRSVSSQNYPFTSPSSPLSPSSPSSPSSLQSGATTMFASCGLILKQWSWLRLSPWVQSWLLWWSWKPKIMTFWKWPQISSTSVLADGIKTGDCVTDTLSVSNPGGNSPPGGDRWRGWW